MVPVKLTASAGVTGNATTPRASYKDGLLPVSTAMVAPVAVVMVMFGVVASTTFALFIEAARVWCQPRPPQLCGLNSALSPKGLGVLLFR